MKPKEMSTITAIKRAYKDWFLKVNTGNK